MPSPESRRRPDFKSQPSESRLAGLAASLAALLAAGPAESKPHDPSSIRIDQSAVKAGQQDEREDLQRDTQAVREAEQLLRQADHQQGQERLLTLTQAADRLGTVTDRYRALLQPLGEIVQTVVRDEAHTPEMDIALAGVVKRAWSHDAEDTYIDANLDAAASSLIADMAVEYPVAMIGQLDQTSNVSNLHGVESLYNLVQRVPGTYSRTADQLVTMGIDPKQIANALGDFYGKYHTTGIQYTASEHITSGGHYDSQRYYYKEAGNSGALRSLGRETFQQRTAELARAFNQSETNSAKIDLVRSDVSLYYQTAIKDGEIPRAEVRTALQLYLDYFTGIQDDASIIDGGLNGIIELVLAQLNQAIDSARE